MCLWKILKVSNIEFIITPLHCVSLLGFTMQCGLKFIKMNLRTLRDEELIVLLGNKFSGVFLSVMGDSYVKSDEKERICELSL